MKFTGFVATYAPQGKNNKQNYFFNGIGKDDVSESANAEFCDSSKRRSIFAVSDASASLARGAETAYICIDILRDFVGSDFSKTNNEYFVRANEIIKGRVFEENGKKVCADMGVLYLNNDCAYAYNIGNVPIFYYNSKGSMKAVSGELPETVDVETVTTDDRGEVVLKTVSKRTVPYIGYMSEEYTVMPHISEKIRFADKDIFLILSQSVLTVLTKSAIERVLADTKLDVEEKTLQILDMAVKANAEGNYTVQLIEVKGGKKIGMFKINSAIVAALLILVIGINCVFGNTVQAQLSKINTGMKNFVVSVMSQLMNVQKNEEEADPWTPLRKEEPEDVNEEAKQSEENLADDGTKSDPEQETKPVVKNNTAPKEKKSWVPWSKPATTPAVTEENPENTPDENETEKNTEAEVSENEEVNNSAEVTEENSGEHEISGETIIYGNTIDVVIPPKENSDTASDAASNQTSGVE